MKRPTLVVAVVASSVALVLGGIAAQTVRSWRQEVRELEALGNMVHVSATYDHAVDTVNSLTIESLAFLADPTPARRATWEASIANALDDLDRIAASGTPDDRALVESLRAYMLPRVAATQQFFDALMAGTPYDGPLPEQHVAERARIALAQAAEGHRGEMGRQIDQRIAEERRQLAISLGMEAIALALVLAFVLVVRRHELRVIRVRADAEIEQLRRAAYTDVLTDLLNFRSFLTALDDAATSARTRNTATTVALLDIDEFRLLNEVRGSNHADEALRVLAAVLRNDCPDAAPFRIGGDRFALLFDSDRPLARARLEALRIVLAERLPILTVSIGASSLVGCAIDAALLREEAEAALHAAKRRGRDTIVFYEDAGDSVQLAFSAAKTVGVRRAIAEQRMDAAFQPIFDLASGELRAFEALARTPADLGLDGPQEAFDVAERIGHTYELDAICRAAVFAGSGALPAGVRLFLNIAPLALLHREFSPQRLADEARAAGIEPGRMVIEITERAGVPAAVLAEHSARLHAAGFRVALDDVGSGNAGLETLRHMSVDVIKIDRMVIANAAADRASRAVLHAIVAFAAESGSEVVAEGIETEAELALVRAIARPTALGRAPRVHLVQGYLLGRPEPVSARQTDSRAA